MSDLDNVLASETADGNTPPPSGTTVNDVVPPIPSTAPAGAPANWLDVLNGFKGAATKQLNRAERLAVDKQNLLEQKTEAELRLQTEKQALEAQVNTERTARSQFEQEVLNLRRVTEIGAKVRTEYPSLVGLHDKGLLRTEGLEGDALTSYLADMEATVSGLADAKLNRTIAGSTPTPPAADDKKGASTTLKEDAIALEEAMKVHGIHSPEYRAAKMRYSANIIANSKSNKD